MKKPNLLIFEIYLLIFILAIFLIFCIFTETGANLSRIIFSPKYYIHFEKLEKVIVCYDSNGFSNNNSDSTYCEVVVTNIEFLKMLEKEYKNKFVNDYFHGGILAEGNYKIIINENIELYTTGLNGFELKFDNKCILVKFNEKIFNNMVKFVENSLE